MDKQSAISIYNAGEVEKRAIQNLQGLCGALVWDKVITDDEIKLLMNWLNQNKFIIDRWPVSDISELLIEILDDGIVTDEERSRLLDLLSAFSADPFAKPVAEGIFAQNPQIKFQGKFFLFTGELIYSKRAKAEKEASWRGGRLAKSVIRDLNYLVVGDKGNREWKFGRYGTKIDTAMEYKSKGADLLIVRECDFVKAIAETPYLEQNQ